MQAHDCAGQHLLYKTAKSLATAPGTEEESPWLAQAMKVDDSSRAKPYFVIKSSWGESFWHASWAGRSVCTDQFVEQHPHSSTNGKPYKTLHLFPFLNIHLCYLHIKLTLKFPPSMCGPWQHHDTVQLTVEFLQPTREAETKPVLK